MYSTKGLMRIQVVKLCTRQCNHKGNRKIQGCRGRQEPGEEMQRAESEKPTSNPTGGGVRLSVPSFV